MNDRSEGCPIANDQLRYRYIEEWGVVVVYSPRFRDVVYLNLSCFALWRLCDGTRTIEDLKHYFASHFSDSNVDLQGIFGDVEANLRKLRECFLVN